MSSKKKKHRHEGRGKPSQVPKLRFPEFREAEGWEYAPLGKLLMKSPDYGVNAAAVPFSELLPKYLRITDISDNGTYLSDKKVSVDLEPKDEIYLDEGDIALARTGASVGKSYRYRKEDGRLVFAGFLIRVKPDPKQLVSTYLANFLTTEQYWKWVTATSARSGQPGINSVEYSSLSVPLPAEFEEQQKIAECLSSVDELMAAQSRKVDALKTHKKGLMQQLFPREGETQPRLRFPEFQNAGEWEATTVGGLVEAGCLSPPKDGNHGNIHPKSSDYVAEGIPFIMASDLNGGVIDIETCHFISKEQADTLQKGFAKEGDVLLSHKGTVGEVAVVRKINTPYLMLTPQVTYYRVKDQNKLSNEFLAQLFVSDAFQSNLVEVSGGGTRAYIGITEQGKLRLQVPEDAEEQQHIADCLNSLDALITSQTQKLAALKTHKKALMQQLFPSPEDVQA